MLKKLKSWIKNKNKFMLQQGKFRLVAEGDTIVFATGQPAPWTIVMEQGKITFKGKGGE
jgi:hypothetical protein